MKKKELNEKSLRRKKRVRAKISGTPDRLRLSVFRSNKYAYVQVIDDKSGRTVFSSSSLKLDDKKQTKSEAARSVGKEVARWAKESGISSMVFDRGSYKFHGRVKSIVEGIREEGIKI